METQQQKQKYQRSIRGTNESYKRPRRDYDKRYLITLNVYNHEIPFYNRKGRGLTNISDYADFLKDNEELITEIFNNEDTLIRTGGKLDETDKGFDMVLTEVLKGIIKPKHKTLKDMYRDELSDDDMSDEDIKVINEYKEGGKLDFYERNIKEFKDFLREL